MRRSDRLDVLREIERQKRKMGNQNKIMAGTLKGITAEAKNRAKRLKRRYRRSQEEKAEYPNEEAINDSVMGFGVNKIFDRDSIFCGLPSVNTLLSYVEVLIDNWNLLPDSKDSKLQARAKTLAIIWRILRHVKISSPTVMDRTDLKEIDFGASRDVVGRLVDEIMEPDEVFRPRHRSALTPPFSMYRYPFASGYMYWITENSDETKSILVTPGITKDDILESLWKNLGRVIQLEASDDLKYVQTELMQKKIFGSSNDLIGKLKEDYRYFREQELSRGYLLIGKPGTGKTAIVNAIVNSVDGRVFIISGLEGPGAVEELESLFVQMRPNFIIFDDCDRSQKTPTFIKAVLKMLETVKDKNPHTNFLFTANTFSGILYDEAVTRKGRIDQIYEVPDPDDADRREIFNGYAEEMSITLSDEDMQKCVTSSDGMMGADIKELCIQLQRASIDEVFERAQEVEHLRVKYSPSEILFDPDDDGSSEFLNTPRRRAKLISSLLKQAKVTGR
jgi:SpoVK/Ycf46/Vps4 family AAA+-type ATPase